MRYVLLGIIEINFIQVFRAVDFLNIHVVFTHDLGALSMGALQRVFDLARRVVVFDSGFLVHFEALAKVLGLFFVFLLDR